MSKFDPNAWYAISETRVDKTNKDLKNSLQLLPEGMRVHPIADDLNWQFHAVDDKKPGRYVMRSFKEGVRKHLAACFVPAEKDASRTRTCLEPASLDASQQWDVSDWGDGTYKIQSVSNGTKYWLDVHRGSDVHLSSIEETNDVKREAQHWVISSRFPVNDDRYSTLFSQQTTTQAAAATTSAGFITRTTPAGDAPASTPTGTAAGASDGSTTNSEPQTSAGLSTGAVAGIGVGVTLAVLASVITLLVFWWKRRQGSRNLAANGEKEVLNLSGGSPQPPSSGVATTVGGPGGAYYGGKEAAPSEAAGSWPQQQQQQHGGVASPLSAGYYYQDQAKSLQSHDYNSPSTLTTTMYEAPTTAVHEAPGPTLLAEMDGTERNYRS